MSDSVQATVDVMNGDGTIKHLSFDEFKNQCEEILDEDTAIEEITASLTVKRQAIKFECHNDYFASVKLGGIGDPLRHLRNSTVTGSAKDLNKVVAGYLTKRVGNMFNFLRVIHRENCKADGIAARHLGEFITADAS
jgi:hypothetical protein